MARFTVGARVMLVEEKGTGRIGTVRKVLPRSQHKGEFDRYRVEFSDGELKVVSDLELSPAGTGTPTVEDVA